MKRSLDSGVSLAGRFGVSDQQRMTAFHPASIHSLSLRLPGPSLSQLKLALVSRLHTTELSSPHPIVPPGSVLACCLAHDAYFTARNGSLSLRASRNTMRPPF